MFCDVYIILLSACIYVLSSGSLEYCMDDTFTARCQPKEVIIMKFAIYGRMRIGKCVKKDLGEYRSCNYTTKESHLFICFIFLWIRICIKLPNSYVDVQPFVRCNDGCHSSLLLHKQR